MPHETPSARVARLHRERERLAERLHSITIALGDALADRDCEAWDDDTRVDLADLAAAARGDWAEADVRDINGSAPSF